MKTLVFCILACLLSAAQVEGMAAQNDMRYFITRSGDRLIEGGKEYRFISFNVPNLHLVEDNMAFEATNEWRFPDEFEIKDALTTIKLVGGRVARTYVISICSANGPNPIPCHVKKPGQFNEEAFRALDRVLEIANRVGIRLVIPLVDNWKWWGGAEQYAAYRGLPPEAFWTDGQVIADFKKTITFLLNRRNTLTGTLYKDDKAILAWETGNELYCPYSWTKEIAAHIKSLDKNHLVWDGYYIGNKEIQPEALRDPNIDIVSSHHYPSARRVMVDDIEKYSEQISGKKVYVLGEVGFVPLAEFRKILELVIRRHISGALLWSLRFHNRDGGFYWHSEPSGGLLYKAYHFPGFTTGEAYSEPELMDLVRRKAFEIQGLAVPPIELPEPPFLLPEAQPGLSWRGSAGASGYDVERAVSSAGPWRVVASNVDDSMVQYRPLFVDETAKPGNSYFYRIRARNSAGISAPSNVVGPVHVTESTMVDELDDFSRAYRHGAGLVIETTNPRPYKEDSSRLKGIAGDWLTYKSAESMNSARVFAFMESETRDLEFYLSRDGERFEKVEPKIGRFPTVVNPYGYKVPTEFDIKTSTSGIRYLKIAYGTAAQISRVEIRSR
jgi:mannan endo-1,4-beta-mannosidase